MKVALEELFFIENPKLHRSDPASKLQLKKFVAQSPIRGIWAYYPWLHAAVHMPPEHIYFRLRTARNRDLIEEDEQRRYRELVVGIAGLSVGSAVVSTLVATGGPRTMKLADPDTIEITNLNRIQAGLPDIGSNKTDVAARRAWELDPFADLHLWRRGVQRDDLEEFIEGSPRLDVFVDEMDNIELKVAARVACKKARVPVVMATDNGDGIIVDIERFDVEPARPIFHGRIRLPKTFGTMDRKQFVNLSSKIIDPALFTERQQKSILEIGKSLSGVPQLGTAAAIAGAAVAYTVRQIANEEDLPSGRYVLGCEQTFINGYNEDAAKQTRDDHTQEFIRALASSRK